MTFYLFPCEGFQFFRQIRIARKEVYLTIQCNAFQCQCLKKIEFPDVVFLLCYGNMILKIFPILSFRLLCHASLSGETCAYHVSVIEDFLRLLID